LSLFAIFGILDRLRGQKGSSRPRTPPLNKTEKKLDWIAAVIFVGFAIYSFFLPLKLDTAWLYLGLLVFLFGMIFVIVAGTNFMNTPPDKPATEGVYRISRNPIYLGTFLIFVGIGIACASWLVLLLITISIILQNITIDAEERWCLEEYGDAYQEYMDRTPKWVGLPKSEKKD
jgi:protein-S-isoprenylcysteine O-methyltransferase Ste14